MKKEKEALAEMLEYQKECRVESVSSKVKKDKLVSKGYERRFRKSVENKTQYLWRISQEQNSLEKYNDKIQYLETLQS